MIQHSFFIVNEASILGLVWRAIRGLGSTVLAVEPFLPHAGGVLERVVDWLVKAGRVVRHQSGLVHFYAEQSGLPGKVEGWIAARFGFSRSDELGDYGFVYRKICHKYLLRRANLVFILHQVKDRLEAGDTLAGGDDDLLGLYEAYFGQALQVHRGLGLVHRGLMAVVIAGMALAGLLRVVTRVRRTPPPVRRCFLAVDRLPDDRDGALFAEFQGQGLEVLYVGRNKEWTQPGPDWVQAGTGRFSLAAAPAAIMSYLRDMVRLARAAWGKHPRLAFDLTVLPGQRMVIRADMANYPCRYFWARDEYNGESVLRTLEIRRIGGISLGLMHGIPLVGHEAYLWRYVCFDTFFVSGDWLAEEFSETWATGMTVAAMGSFGMSGDFLKALPPLEERPDRILVFVNLVPNLGLVEAVMDELCRDFPDRPVCLKMKDVWRDLPDIAAMRERLSGHANFEDSVESPYTLMGKANIAFSTPSTVVLEAMQAGLPTFVIDEGTWPVRLCFRRVPSLCITSPREVVDKVRGGGGDYDWTGAATFTPLDGRNFTNVVREALGVPDAGAQYPDQ